MMRPGITRRRFVAIAAGALPLAKFGMAWAAPGKPVRWQGVALGARAQIVLLHADEALARAALRAAIAELSRLEAVFSLYEPNSEISRLNRDGRLQAPSSDLVHLLAQAEAISEATGGAFDITVQPLFEAYRKRRGARLRDDELVRARALVDHRKLRITPGRLAFTQPAMAATLNGIAQGYITDRISDLLRRHGFTNTLVDLGEIKANQGGPQGRGWPVAIADPAGPTDHGKVLTRVTLTNRALATSAASGHFFDRDGSMHHLVEPHSGRPAGHYRSLSVTAPNATLADALST